MELFLTASLLTCSAQIPVPAAKFELDCLLQMQTRNWSPNKDLVQPVYILTRKRDPLQLQRPSWKSRGDTDTGSQLLLFQAGSIPITAWAYCRMHVQEARFWIIAVLCGVTEFDLERSLSSVVLSLSSRLMLRSCQWPYPHWPPSSWTLHCHNSSTVKRLRDNQVNQVMDDACLCLYFRFLRIGRLSFWLRGNEPILAGIQTRSSFTDWGGPLTRRQTSWHFEGLKIGPKK